MNAGWRHPEPLTFSLRALRVLRQWLGDFDVVHDNQGLGDRMLGVRRLGPAARDQHPPPDHRRPSAGPRLR